MSSAAFTFSDTSLQVDEVLYSAYEMCLQSPNSQWYASQSATYQFTAAGIFYFVADSAQNCIQGMRFTANVYPNGSIMIPPISSPPTTSPVHFTCTVVNFMFWVWRSL